MAVGIRVVAAAISWQGKWLAARRARGALKGLWEFPGGKVESGETDPEALKREIREELGLDIEIGEKLGEFVTPDNPYLVLVVFLATAQEGSIKDPTDHDLVEWLDLEDLAHRQWAPADVPAISRLQSRKGQRQRT